MEKFPYLSHLSKHPTDTTVVVGMSGGVDSSVVAALLKDQGFKVIGLFMKNWEEDLTDGSCPAAEDFKDVQAVCEHLDIPYYPLNFAREYREDVFQHFLHEYQAGRTPNPDVLCNKEIKFKVFYDYAMKLGADYLATGHYAQTRKHSELTYLGNAIDQNKDQTYFLHAIEGKVLDKVLFPLGALEKREVRELAVKYSLANCHKKDSTGVCFIGEKNFKQFLGNHLGYRRGDFVTLSHNKVGEHQGSSFYTIGQRKGLGLGGPGEPWYVVGKNLEKNQVIVERGELHPALYYDNLILSELTWIHEAPADGAYLACKVRYRQSQQMATLHYLDAGRRLKVDFDVPQRALALGQSVVFYQKGLCLGGGVIQSTGSNYFEQKKSLPQVITI